MFTVNFIIFCLWAFAIVAIIICAKEFRFFMDNLLKLQFTHIRDKKTKKWAKEDSHVNK